MFSGDEDMIKLIDFGLCQEYKVTKDLQEIVGTPFYMAPEVIQGHYGVECDVWSLGVCIYQFLCGKIPFDTDGTNNIDELFGEILSGQFVCDPQFISPEAEDLLRKMLQVDPKERITAAQALNHPWIIQSEHHRDLNEI